MAHQARNVLTCWSITLTGALLGYGASTGIPLLAFIAGYVVGVYLAVR